MIKTYEQVVKNNSSNIQNLFLMPHDIDKVQPQIFKRPVETVISKI